MTEPFKASRSIIPGILLILLGLFFFAVNFLNLDFTNLWPFMFLIPSAVFVVLYFRDRRQFGLLMPATIFFVYAALFLACQNRGWYLMERLWPVFILAPGLGLFVMYFFGRKETGFLIPATILTGLSIFFLLVMNGFPEYWPAILILVGLIILLRPKVWNQSSAPHDKTSPGV